MDNDKGISRRDVVLGAGKFTLGALVAHFAARNGDVQDYMRESTAHIKGGFATEWYEEQSPEVQELIANAMVTFLGGMWGLILGGAEVKKSKPDHEEPEDEHDDAPKGPSNDIR